MARIKLRNYLPYLLTLFFITGPWFFKSGYLFFTDMSWGPNWAPDPQSGLFLLYSLIKLLSFILPLDLVQKIFISFVLLVVMLGGKKIAEIFLNDKVAVFLVSLFALFNPFVYDRFGYGQFGALLALGFLGLAIGYLLEYWRGGNSRQILWSGLFAGLAFQLSPHFLFFFVIFYSIFFLWGILKNDRTGKKRLVFNTVLAIFIGICLNFNWLAGLFYGDSDLNKFLNYNISEQDLAAFQTSGSTTGEVAANVVMMSGFWGKDQFRYLDLKGIKENWGRSFFLLLPLIIWGVIEGIRNKRSRLISVGLLVLFLAAVILAVGIRMPVAKEITFYLFDNFPPYRGLRETHKWVAVIVIIYTIFLSLGLSRFYQKKIVVDNKFITSFFLGGLIVMQASFLLFGFSRQVNPVNYPEDWQEINEDIVKENNCKNNLLFLPWHMYMSFSWVGNIVTNPAPVFFSCPVLSGTNMEWGGIYDSGWSREDKLINNWIATKGRNSLAINELNIGYIILAKEVDWGNYLWLENNKDTELLKETKTLKLYVVTSQ
ncbi:MAG: hypothetical protein PHD51_03040 [Patescibacteria group bacterium]|nr:hypothetical protein [Patescibacteria group bacterium]MDD5490170.1 hypothetical protein [Patescibacteria group bacterium]